MGSALCGIRGSGSSKGASSTHSGVNIILKQKQQQEQQKQQKNQIEAQLRAERAEERRVAKLLLLGPSDSGKSTITKQMRILHSGGFNDSELINYRFVVRANLITCYHHVAEAIAGGLLGPIVPAEELSADGGDEEVQQLVEMFQRYHTKLLYCDEEDQVRALAAIGACTCVKKATQRLSEFSAPDNCKYLISQAGRISQANYRPNEEDVVHARVPTTGVHEINFTFRRFNIRLIDVGGQRSERRKWIHCFDSVTAVLFVASLASYDLPIEEGEELPSTPTMTATKLKKNRVEGAVELFQQMYWNAYLKHAPFILFLNKKDIFAQKLGHSLLQDHFSSANYHNKQLKLVKNYTFEHAIDFIKDLFLECQSTGHRLDEEDKNRYVYVHVTNATDKANISFMFGASCDAILSKNVSNSGMA